MEVMEKIEGLTEELDGGIGGAVGGGDGWGGASEDGGGDDVGGGRCSRCYGGGK